MRSTGAEIITTLLERQGVEIVAGIPGGANLPLYDALRRSPIRHILARHEQGAGFIAQGMARATGRAGVCLATSGPGATNLLTAIADAKLDSIPLVAITGQVPSALIGTDAFQEVDTYGLTAPITKHNYLVRRASELLSVIPEAFSIAESGRPGPVVVDVPKDVATQQIELEAWPEPGRRRVDDSGVEVTAIARAIERAERPVLFVGGGVVAAGAAPALTALARQSNIPVATTLHGLGAFPADDRLHLGMVGMHGARATNLVLEEADLLIALGVRFDDRATGAAEQFCSHASIIHVDIDPSEIGKIKPSNIGVVADVAAVCRGLSAQLKRRKRWAWNERIEQLRRTFPRFCPDRSDPFHPVRVIELLAQTLCEHTIITTDVGQHQMWVAQYYPFRHPRTLQSSGGLGTMGFGLPAAIGAALARPEQRVVCVSGDGSLLMNLQELATLAEHQLNVAVVIFNNRQLGLVHQQQELFYGGRYHATEFVGQLDFGSLAKGFGLHSINLATVSDPEAALRQALRSGGPTVIDVPVHPTENVLPMVPPGGANRSMIDREVAHG